MRQFGGLSAPVAVLVLFLFCCYLGLYHGFFGLLLSLLAGRGRDYRRALVTAPFLWVAVELARTRITGFPWNLLGIAQVDNVALCRIAAWTGVYGISFEIVLVNVALAAAFLVPREKRGAMLVAALAAAAVLQAGSWSKLRPAKPDHLRAAGAAKYSGLRQLDAGVFSADPERTDRPHREVRRRQSGEDRSDRLARIARAVLHQRSAISRMPSATWRAHTKAWIVAGSIGSDVRTSQAQSRQRSTPPP